jgi:hypothetical protein
MTVVVSNSALRSIIVETHSCNAVPRCAVALGCHDVQCYKRNTAVRSVTLIEVSSGSQTCITTTLLSDWLEASQQLLRATATILLLVCSELPVRAIGV